MQNQFLFYLFAIVFCFSFSSCQLADLRPSELQDQTPSKSQLQGARLALSPLQSYLNYRSLDPKTIVQPKRVQIVLFDHWYSGLYRRLSSLPENKMKLKIEIENWGAEPSQLTVQFLDGSWKEKVYGISNDELYRIEDGNRVYFEDSSLKIYIQSLGRYLQLPYRTQEIPSFLLSPSTEKEISFQRIYTSTGGWKASKDHNQYIFFLPASFSLSQSPSPTDSKAKDLKILPVEFTYRELLDSYKGLLIYNDFSKEKGVDFPIPKTIGIWNGFQEKDPVHEITIESFLLLSVP